jgi:1-acyl-sn-glycerol-3-phosphate acyltransferase
VVRPAKQRARRAVTQAGRAPSAADRAAADPTRAVDWFQAELARLDHELDEEIVKTRGAQGHGLAQSFLSRLGQLHPGAALEAIARLRGSERADEFGLDPAFEELVEPLFAFLYRRWWRVEARGLANVPDSGPALIVANHAGAMFPYDGAMLKVALRMEHPAARELRPLVDDFVFRAPFLASLMTRVGGVRASPENAERLLRRGEVVAVFPEGLRGMRKRFTERYRLQRFGRGGFVALALKTATPIVPVAVIGAEEIHPLLATLEWPAKILGLPYFPLTPTFPWLGPLGLVPLPSKWILRFGEPMDCVRLAGDAANPVLVDRLTHEVRDTIQEMVVETLRERGPAFG